MIAPISINLKMFFVYILHSLQNGRYYVGSCENVKERVRQHNARLVKSTKSYVPWELIYREKYLTLSEARRREFQIKGWKKRSSIERLIKHF